MDLLYKKYMTSLILAISENGKFITEESSPLSANINHFLNAGYLGNVGKFGTFILVVILIIVIAITRNRQK